MIYPEYIYKNKWRNICKIFDERKSQIFTVGQHPIAGVEMNFFELYQSRSAGSKSEQNSFSCVPEGQVEMLLFRSGEGKLPGNWQLLKSSISGDRREFRSTQAKSCGGEIVAVRLLRESRIALSSIFADVSWEEKRCQVRVLRELCRVTFQRLSAATGNRRDGSKVAAFMWVDGKSKRRPLRNTAEGSMRLARDESATCFHPCGNARRLP